jgi:hypothetical protein
MGLPELHQQRFREFMGALEKLEPQANELVAFGASIQAEIAQLQKNFQEEILTLSLEILPAASAQQVQAFQVEMNKQLRLLNMDSMFLQVARQPTTIAQRQHQIRDRLKILIRYCALLLKDEA